MEISRRAFLGGYSSDRLDYPGHWRRYPNGSCDEGRARLCLAISPSPARPPRPALRATFPLEGGRFETLADGSASLLRPSGEKAPEGRLRGESVRLSYLRQWLVGRRDPRRFSEAIPHESSRWQRASR